MKKMRVSKNFKAPARCLKKKWGKRKSRALCSDGQEFLWNACFRKKLKNLFAWKRRFKNAVGGRAGRLSKSQAGSGDRARESARKIARSVRLCFWGQPESARPSSRALSLNFCLMTRSRL